MSENSTRNPGRWSVKGSLVYCVTIFFIVCCLFGTIEVGVRLHRPGQAAVGGVVDVTVEGAGPAVGVIDEMDGLVVVEGVAALLFLPGGPAVACAKNDALIALASASTCLHATGSGGKTIQIGGDIDFL